jgi:membrane fusion protein (multidrug efflux system)
MPACHESRRFPLLAGIGLATLLAGCGQEAAKPPALPPAEVRFITAEASTVPVVREYVGTVAAYRSVQVRARVEGVLLKRHFTEGTNVTQGQLLYSIDPDNYEAALRDAQAALAQAEANLANAKAREGRYAPLAKEDAISKQDYDDAVTQLRQAESSVQSARAQLDRARLNLGYTRILATENGRIGTSQVPEGALVGKGEPTLLATIDKLDPIYANFTMPDRDALMLQRALRKGEIRKQGGDSAKLVMPDGSAFAQAGRIDFADAQVNRETGTITLRAVLPNRGEPPLLPGMFVHVHLTVGQRPGVIVIPQRAVMKLPSGHAAFVVTADNKAERRDLVVGEWINDGWIIEKGLAAGDKVIVDGIQKVQPGATLNPVALAAKNAPSAEPGAGAAKDANSTAKQK